jgi:type IV secretion system protein VirB5
MAVNWDFIRIRKGKGSGSGAAETGGVGDETLEKTGLGETDVELTENPYLNARRSWNSYVDSIKAVRNIWMVVGMASLMIALCAVGGISYIGSQSKYIPYVIQVDKFGDTISMGPLARTNNADPRVIRASLSEFIRDLRMVTPDGNLQKKAVFKVYSMVNNKDPAYHQVEQIYSDSKKNPFKRAADELVTVSITSILEQTDNTWNVDWEETTMTRDGTPISKKMWRATVTIYIASQGDDVELEQLINNPMGVFVHNFSWQEIS